MTIDQRLAAAPLRKWSEQDLQYADKLKQCSTAILQIGSSKLKPRTFEFELDKVQNTKLEARMQLQAQDKFSIDDQKHFFKTFGYHCNKLDFATYKQYSTNFIHNKFYDPLFVEIINKELQELGLTERFAKTEVTINGKTVELQKYIRDCDQLFTGDAPED